MNRSAPSNKNNLDNLLGGLTAQEFLDKYWQKRPLFIPGALANLTSPLSPDELAGLACEPEVESRLVLEFAGPKPWTLEHGPFDEERFADLPETHWSLLVQECNKFSPELAELMQRFDFIPHWRIDDVMASYAPAEGSVGPHVDQYDVFLIQAMGKRRWKIKHGPIAEDNLLPDLELNIMRDFEADEEWVVEPGDLLYLPPGVAHYGVALDDCITLSVGFRAPTHSEIITEFLDHTASHMDQKLRYGDPDLSVPQHPGEISHTSLERIRQVIRDAVADDKAIDDWFGEFITEAKSAHHLESAAEFDQPELDAEYFLDHFKRSVQLERVTAARFAFIQQQEATMLFVDGHKFELPPESAQAAALLCDQQHYTFDELSAALENEAFLETVTQLHNLGYLELDDAEFVIKRVAWGEAERQLRAIRTAVFIVEQNVPAELEWDDQDKHSIHALARDRGGRPIGSVRILNDGHIGRLAVLAEFRGKGVGSALLKTAIKIAQHNDMDNIVLNAQTQAIDFYQRHGFVADDEIFMEAGIPHQKMTLVTSHVVPHTVHEEPEPPIDLKPLVLGDNREIISLFSRTQHRELSIHMAEQATRTLRLFTYRLDASVYDNEPFLEALKKLAIAGPNTKIYILLQDPTDVVLHGHRLVELSRRVSSHIFIHRADEDDQKRFDNFLIADQSGFIRRPHPKRYEGAACFNSPAEARKYTKFFEEAWERSMPEPELRRLHL